ncbi:MAG TPA: LysR family transcriptional regulator [Candidatus Limosilactobacillus merdigallinarum]|uniref:LysR family transcriptional regulator n=1 Tax=Candidatus Limosilactobacillus merdigallinarum TaxID=2838652 RepID=A0A9D1VIY0_9LACO|nr:LysR family transcriptional regulator [Candidatus Limosilactobacillus merdigallinarum]
MQRITALENILATGSFTAAAKQLGYTQSAISQMIASLEKELGVQVLARSNHHVQLTPEGQRLMPLLSQTAKDWDNVKELAQEITGLKSAVIKIGTISSISAHWLPQLIKKFQALHPGVRFVMLQGDYTTIPEWIHNNEIDFGFVNPAAMPQEPVKFLRAGDLRAILPIDHPLAKEEAVLLTDLKDEPFLMLEEGLYSEPLEAFHENGIEPNIKLRVHDDYSILSMVEAGLGFSILADLVLQKQSYNVAIRPLIPNVQRRIGILQKPRELMPIASQQFVDFIIQHRAALP